MDGLQPLDPSEDRIDVVTSHALGELKHDPFSCNPDADDTRLRKLERFFDDELFEDLSDVHSH
ncbi:MAG: hypothetical protein ACYCR4_14220 [Acidimicrobiales bacterium]